MKNQNGKRANGANGNGIKPVLSVAIKSLNIYLLAGKHQLTKRHAQLPVAKHLSASEQNKMILRIARNNRRAIEAGEPGALTLSQWLVTLDYFGWQCAYCQGRYDVIEHFYPIGQGRGTTAINCVPSCNRCNSAKRDKHPFLTHLTARQIAVILHYFWNAPADNDGEPVYITTGPMWQEKLIEL